MSRLPIDRRGVVAAGEIEFKNTSFGEEVTGKKFSVKEGGVKILFREYSDAIYAAELHERIDLFTPAKIIEEILKKELEHELVVKNTPTASQVKKIVQLKDLLALRRELDKKIGNLPQEQRDAMSKTKELKEDTEATLATVKTMNQKIELWSADLPLKERVVISLLIFPKYNLDKVERLKLSQERKNAVRAYDIQLHQLEIFSHKYRQAEAALAPIWGVPTVSAFKNADRSAAYHSPLPPPKRK
jgi:hypothetical protein